MSMGNCRAFGSANGSDCGVLGYAAVDAQYADKVVVVTDTLVPFPNVPASIDMTNVDYVVKVDAIGDPSKIATGAAKPTTDQRKLLMAKYAADFMTYMLGTKMVSSTRPVLAGLPLLPPNTWLTI